jgi:hypothetical protein
MAEQKTLVTVKPVKVSEIVRKGMAIYEQLKSQLEREHWGKYVVIDPDSGDYEVAPTRTEALLKIRQRHPEKGLFLAAHRLFGEKEW